MIDKKTPIKQVPAFELTIALASYVRQAYFRRSRQLPANINEMVECLKGDLLKHFKDCPIGTVDDAITTATLFDNDKPISVAFFFEAVKKIWWQPKTNVHNYEDVPAKTDTEANTISLLDTCADILKDNDGHAVADPDKPLKGCIALPAFNAKREYGYLVMRGQLDAKAASHFFIDALPIVNTDLRANHHHRLSKEEAKVNCDVWAQAMRLAVLDWLRGCNTLGKRPSDILTPLPTNTPFDWKEYLDKYGQELFENLIN